MQEQQGTPPKTKLHRHFLKTLLWVLIVVTITFLASFLALNYFGEHLLKRYLQEKIHRASSGVYAIDFETFHFNILSGKTTVTEFQLIPDEMRYNELKEQGLTKNTLYSLVYKKLILSKLNLREVVFDKTIHLRMIELEQPTVSFVAFPDSIPRKRGRFRLIYQDIYPMLSAYFTEVRIDSILVTDGSFSGKQLLKSGKTSEGDWLYSVILRDFDLNADDYLEQRIFYSKDVEMKIRNFNYSLSDSLYFLTADEVGFSLTGSRLFGKGLSLTPNLLSSRISGSKEGSFYQVYLPEFSVAGVDLYKAMLEKQISISSMHIDNLDVRMYHHVPAGPVMKRGKAKISVANLYTIIQDKLKNITIDTFLLHNASFQFYPGVTVPKPELKIDRATLQLQGFQLDSLAHLDTTRILYAREIEFDLKGFTLALRDKLHDLNAREVVISTRKSLIDVFDTRLYPSSGIGPTSHFKSNSLYRMTFPQVTLEQVNLLRMFNTRNLEFARLAIFEPDMSIIQYRDKQVVGDTAMNGKTFLQKLDLVSSLVTPYMISLQAGVIEVSNALISFKDDKEGLDEERITGLVDLTLTGFRVDSLTYQNRKEFINGLELTLALRDFRYLSPDSLHRIRLDELFVNSLSGELDIHDFSLLTTSRPEPETDAPSTLVAQFRKLQVYGFDHRKWLDAKWFSARDIRLEEPRIIIRSIKRKRESTLNEPFAEVDQVLKKIEINSLTIDRGWFDLREEDQTSTGSILVPNFDFQLSGFLFDLTGWSVGRKILRYDLLSLTPDTTHPILLDSAYSIRFSRFLSDSYPPNLAIGNLRIHPLDPGETESRKGLAVELIVPSCSIHSFDLEKFLFDRDLRIGEIRIGHPEITLNRYPEDRKNENDQIKTIPAHPELKTPFRSMDIGKMVLSDGIFHLISAGPDGSSGMDLNNINTTITRFRYDSSSPVNRSQALFYCDDIDLQTGGYSFVTRDSMNTLSLSGMHLSTGNSTLSLDSFALTPNFSDFEYSRRLGYQTDRMEMKVPGIQVERLDFVTLLEMRKIVAGLVVVDGMTLDDYRDKRVAFPTWKRPPMIQQALQKIHMSVRIDSVSLTNGKVIYREQTGSEPGMIFLDRMEGLIRNFTTDSVTISSGATLIADGSAYLMGEAPVSGEFRFLLQSPADTFLFTGKTGRVDMTSLNPMVSKVAPVKIKSGVVDSVNILWIRGNGTIANGLLDLYYQDLQIELLKEKQGFWNKTLTDMMQLLVNMAVPQENPGYFGIHRQGYIWNKRNDEKGFFNFFWKSILTGLKSSEGLNSKEQRDFKKELKKGTQIR